MKDFLSNVKEHFRGRWIVLTLLLVGSLFCTLYAANGNFPLAAAVCAIPFLLIVTGMFVNHPVISFLVLFTVNYGIMGIIRYVSFPLPISVAIDVLFLFTLAVLCVNLIKGKVEFKQESIPFLLLYGVWVAFCLIQAFNNTTGVGFQFGPWFKEVRPMAFHALYVILIFTLLFNKNRHIKYFLYVWGAFILLAAVKAYIQRNRGFDSYELAWLWSVGARTHFIHSGIRYFSFFSDAANFGSNMAFSMVTYAVCFLYERNKYSRIYFLVVAVAAGYGMFMSGTRSALMVAIAGFVLYTLLSRNVRLFMISCSFLILSIGILKFTTIGQGNQFVRRMRTAFDPEDASLQVRLNNQKAIKSYMSEAPWGIGMGVGMGADQLPQNNKYWIVSVTPSDSTLVYIWMRTGVVGLVLFLLLMSLAVVAESFIVLFRIRNKELRGILTAFTCGSACMLVAAYGNNIYTQYPNTLLVFGLQTLVFMGPYFDRQITSEKEKALVQKEREKEKDALQSDNS
ncbi:MAG: O-antigen ligase family protein [Bacteroidaceae bacterium]|nr:O-antigen ligase family protein [Bacteroidaceae bacterium]